jgi:hypothetical protein
MDYQSLEQNITDVIAEQQIKLGYRSEVVRLYYPLSSLNHLLGLACDVLQMEQALRAFCTYVQTRLGAVGVTHEDERFCFAIPPEGVDYIHRLGGNQQFLKELIATVGRHGVTMQEIEKIFQRYSACVHVERVHNGEFDWLLYFEDGVPDSYLYCFKDEGAHIIYHRFTADDYKDFGF